MIGTSAPARVAGALARAPVWSSVRAWPWRRILGGALPVVGVHAIAAVVRFWQLDHIGFNSDEAVYAGSAAGIAGDPVRQAIFPVFRAHPVLFQMLVSLAFRAGGGDWSARAVSAVAGILTVTVVYLLGRRLYGHRAGVIAALLLALMPYHVVVTRQALLDGLMTLLATVVLYCVVRYAESMAAPWLLAAGAAMGATVMAKETSLVLVGGLYVFFALTPVMRLRVRHLVLAVAAMGAVLVAIPIVLAASNRSKTGGSYLLWQIFRRPNHELLFYFSVVPWAVGIGVIIVAAAGLVWLRRENTWRERLLIAWVAVPVVFFTVWPVKGYQYLLPVAPVFAVLAGRTLARLPEAVRAPGSAGRPGMRGALSVLDYPRGRVASTGVPPAARRWPSRLRVVGIPWLWARIGDGLASVGALATGLTRSALRAPWLPARASEAATRLPLRIAGLRRTAWFPVVVTGAVVTALAASLAVPAWRQIAPSTNATFLAGTGGLPGGREAGLWVRDHVPEGAQLLTIGPSMANVLEFYGGRHASALSVSPNPAARNPSYLPVTNPDRALRDGRFQYIVWDSYTAGRTAFFAETAMSLVQRFHGVAVYTATVTVDDPAGGPTVVPVIIIYRVAVQ